MTPVCTFAYGMNMYPHLMPEGARGEAAYLDGYRLAWRGFADVEPTEDDLMVPGVLWELPGTLRMLDEREGYPSLYTRDLVTVRTADGPHREAWVYRMTASTVADYRRRRISGQWSCGDTYMHYVAEGREAFGLDTADLLLA